MTPTAPVTPWLERWLARWADEEYRRLLVDGLWIEAKSLLAPVRRAVLQHKAHLVADHEGDVPVILAPYDSQVGLQLP